MDIVQSIDLTYLIEAIIGVLIAVLMRYLIPWLKAKLTNEQEQMMVTFFDIAVMAAEKIYGAKKGDEKLAYVEQQLAARGWKVDTMRLKAYVNAAIQKMDQMKPLEIEAASALIAESDATEE